MHFDDHAPPHFHAYYGDDVAVIAIDTLEVIEVEALEGHRLRVKFDDGVAGIVCLSERLFGPVFEPLKDPAFFGQVGIDEFGAVCWPNGADLAPDALHVRLRNQVAPVT